MTNKKETRSNEYDALPDTIEVTGRICRIIGYHGRSKVGRVHFRRVHKLNIEFMVGRLPLLRGDAFYRAQATIENLNAQL